MEQTSKDGGSPRKDGSAIGSKQKGTEGNLNSATVTEGSQPAGHPSQSSKLKAVSTSQNKGISKSHVSKKRREQDARP